MMRLLRQFVRTGLLFAAVCATTLEARAAIKLSHVWTHDAGGPAAAEIVTYDSEAKEFLVGNGADRCVMRLDARTGKEVGRFDVSMFGDPTSVAASHGLVAVAVVAPQKADPGQVVLFRSATEKPVAVIRVGALPDMVTFTPNGRYVLSANEGEPSADYRADPEGSISVIDLSKGPEHAVALTADFVRFNHQRESIERTGVRITAPSATESDHHATLAQDAEPEYIAVAPDGRTAWVTLQENNAIAIVDVASARVKQIVGLGLKDFSARGNGFDASDRDGEDGSGRIHIRHWPVFGMFMPDAIAAIDVDGSTYIVTANEGDTRGYEAFNDQARVKDLELDESLQVNADLQGDAALGRLNVSSVGGDTDGDGDVDRLLAFGGRSVAIWTAEGKLVYDSGDALERFIAEHLPERFNINSEDGDVVDERSPEKGPEPEGLAVGRVGEATYAFVGLERTSAIAVFDVTRPDAAKLIDVVPLPLAADQGDATGGPHIAPEGVCFVPAERSPLGSPLVAVSCEVTGTTLLFRVDSVAAR